MTKLPKVSVVVPVYNTEATLPRCIESVLAQTFRDFELVLVDDGSPDNAGAVCDDYAARHDCICVVHQANAGLAEARRAGLHAAKGEFIVPLDSDDELPPDAIQLLLDHCEKENLDLCYGAFLRVCGEKRALFPHSHVGVMTGEEFLHNNLWVKGNNAGSCFNMSRHSAWHDDVFPPRDKRFPSEDVLINVRLAKYLNRVGFYNDCVYIYYVNPQSLSQLGSYCSLNAWAMWFGEVRTYLTANGLLTPELEHSIREMEVDHLAFYVKQYDENHPWQREVMAYDCSGYGRKTRTLHALLGTPRLLKFLINANRWVKTRLLGKIV